MITDVALWFARNSKGEIKTINEVSYHDDTYYCPLCNSEVIPKALKSNSKVTEHFAHLDRSKCDSESMIHWWYKNKFLQNGDRFIIKTDKEKEYVCNEILFEKLYHTDYGDYKPDVTVLTESGDTIFFEYNYTNKKQIKDYIDKWFKLGSIVVEVNIKTLMESSYGKDVYKFNALFYKGKCFNTKKNDVYYNTLGKYKEEYYSKEESNLTNEKIKNLNWFWNDIQNYKLDRINVDDLYTSFNEAIQVDFDLIKNVLIKSKCTKIFYECINIRQKYFLEYANNYLISCGFNNTIAENWSTNGITVFNIVIDLEKCDTDIISRIHNVCNDELNNIKHIKALDFARSNNTLKMMINKINNEVKQINDNYNFYDRFSYDLFINFSYEYSTLIDESVPYEIAYSNNEYEIEEFLKDIINKYFDNLVPNDKTGFDDMINYLNNNYEKVWYWYKYEYKVRRHYYKTQYEKHGFKIECKEYNPEYLVINLIETGDYHDRSWSHDKKVYFIFKNRLYCNIYESYINGNVPKESILLLNDCSDKEQLKNILMKEFSNTIRKIKFKED